MKQKKHIEAPKKELAAPVVFSWSPTISTKVFYGTFLSLSLLLSTALVGGSMTVTRLAKQGDVLPQKSGRVLALEHRVSRLVAGYPIAVMSELIAKEEKTTAAFLVGIAKKESNWGKHVPRDENGADCFNYWGYRGAGSRGIAMGHGCFASPEEAIGVVGGRLDTFIQQYKFRTARELVVWKCGFSCDGHSKESVAKWITDVGYYQKKVAD